MSKLFCLFALVGVSGCMHSGPQYRTDGSGNMYLVERVVCVAAAPGVILDDNTYVPKYGVASPMRCPAGQMPLVGAGNSNTDISSMQTPHTGPSPVGGSGSAAAGGGAASASGAGGAAAAGGGAASASGAGGAAAAGGGAASAGGAGGAAAAGGGGAAASHGSASAGA